MMVFGLLARINILFNFARTNYYDSPMIYLDAYGSPENTEWSFGRTEDLSPENYQPWQATIGGHNPRGAIGGLCPYILFRRHLF